MAQAPVLDIPNPRVARPLKTCITSWDESKTGRPFQCADYSGGDENIRPLDQVRSERSTKVFRLAAFASLLIPCRWPVDRPEQLL